jgi:hypothetical protein
MIGRTWKLRRLMAMSPDEVAYRFGAAARDRFAPHAWTRWTAREAAAHWLVAKDDDASRERWASVAHVPAADDCASSIVAAQHLAEGRWTLFGHEAQLADPPRWNQDPLSGVAWPDLPGARLDYRRPPAGASAKATWETGRLTFLPTLALAARASGDARHAERARRWLADFMERNPLGRGIHHASGIEMAIRVMTIGWTLALLEGVVDGAPHADGASGNGSGESATLERAARGFMAQQAMWCREHLSIGSSANNHLLAEYAAMVVAGAGVPGWPDGPRLVREGLEGIERELPRQIHADGVTAEQAFRYLPFVWELVLPALILAERAGHKPGDATRMRLSLSLEFARSMRRSDGMLPPIGDEDDARILLADQSETRLDLAGNALAAWLGVPALSDGASALAFLLTGLAAPPSARGSEGLREFREGGHTVWRHREAFATLDHGPLGLGPLAAHGHADALSLTLRHGNDDLIVDPGTLSYEDEEARHFTRATSRHSTIHFGGRSQSEMLGPFLWGRRANTVADRNGWWCLWWSGERHWRHVTFGPSDLIIQDETVGPAPEIVFALPPGADIRVDGIRATVVSGGSAARFEAAGISGWEVVPAEFASSFSRRQPSKRLVARMPDERCRTVVRFGAK